MVRARELFIPAWAVGVLVLVSLASGCGKKNQLSLGDAGDDAAQVATAALSDDGSSGGRSGGGSSGGIFSGADASAAAACTGGGLQCYVPAGCTTSLSGTVYDPGRRQPALQRRRLRPERPARERLPPSSRARTRATRATCRSATTWPPRHRRPTAPSRSPASRRPRTSRWSCRSASGAARCSSRRSRAARTTDRRLVARRACRRSAPRATSRRWRSSPAEPTTSGASSRGSGSTPSEYSAPHGGGRLDIYQGQGRGGRARRRRAAPGLSNGGTAGDCTSDNPNCVWNSKANLETYDIVLLACEGDTFDPATSRTNGSTEQDGDRRSRRSTTGSTRAARSSRRTSTTPGSRTARRPTSRASRPGSGSPAAPDRRLRHRHDASRRAWSSTSGSGTSGRSPGTRSRLTSVAESVSTVNSSAQRWIYNPAAIRRAVRRTTRSTCRSSRPSAASRSRPGRGRDHRAVLRQGGLQRSARRRQPRRRHPGRVRGPAAVGAAQGARVPLLRSLGVRLERQPAAAPRPQPAK